MYFKYLRYLAFALGGLCTVVAAGALFLYATFDGARLDTLDALLRQEGSQSR